MLLSMTEQHSCNYTFVITRIESLMSKKEISRADLARHLKMTRSSVTQKLNGDIGLTLSDITKIANLFDVSVDWLLGREPMEVK